MTRIALFGRSRAAALLTATVTTLSGCQVTAPHSGTPQSQEGSRVTFPTLTRTAPPAAPTIVQVQGREAAGSNVAPDIASGGPRNLAQSRTSNSVVTPDGTTVVFAPATPAACAPGSSAAGGGSFWSEPRPNRRNGADRLNEFGQPDLTARPAWQNLPLLLGDQGRSSAGSNVPVDHASGGPRRLVHSRTSVGADANGGTGSISGVTVEAATDDGLGSIGATAGLQTRPNGDSGGLAPSLFVKRVFSSSDDGMFGGGFGGTLPAGDGAPGNIFPWVFCATRVTGDTWAQGLAGVHIPFESSSETFGFVDYGLVVPLFTGGGRAGRGAQVYFMPELHANYRISGGGDGADSTGFVLNTTLGFGARVGAVDVQAGMAFPLLNDRFYDYESMLRISYWY